MYPREEKKPIGYFLGYITLYFTLGVREKRYIYRGGIIPIH
jgi:hypothetical protein